MKFWRSPLARVLLLFMVGIILPTGFLVYLGVLSIHSETLLLKKESEERLGKTLQAMRDQAETLVAGSHRELDHFYPRSSWIAPADALLVVAVDSANRLIYPIREARDGSPAKLPPLRESQHELLRQAEEAEFRDKEYSRALDKYQSLERNL